VPDPPQAQGVLFLPKAIILDVKIVTRRKSDIISIDGIFNKGKDMKTYWPSYYRDFRCKAGSCIHTCCAGWEIGIDEASMERFNKYPDITDKIADGGFILRRDGRCPFLRDDNLCDMIIEHGEDFICDICKEHPRFYNGAGDHVEAGLGLVCEEACRLVLGMDKVFELISEDGKKMELPEYIRPVFDKTRPLSERLTEISGGKRAGSKLRAEIFDGMEVLDPKWTVLLKKIIDDPLSAEEENRVVDENEKELANFAGYLLYRYRGAGRFAAEATYLIADLAAKGCGICDVVRAFSGEIEYSDINIDEALDTFA